MLFKSREKILFIGDSITDCRRREADYKELGWGYVSFIANIIDATAPELELEYINRGIGGNTVQDLKERWQEDCIDIRPDWLSILVGINDVVRHVKYKEESLGPQPYYNTYREILQETIKKTPAKIFLWEPFFFITPNTTAPKEVAELLPLYIEAVHNIADEFKDRIAAVIQTQRLFTESSQKRWIEFWVPEGVHPSKQGHMLMAKEFLHKIGIEITLR